MRQLFVIQPKICGVTPYGHADNIVPVGYGEHLSRHLPNTGFYAVLCLRFVAGG